MTTTKSLEEICAISRLRALGQGVHVFYLDQDQLYCVPSVSGEGSAYQFQVSGESMLCSCPAGQHDRYCLHVAAVEMFRESQICGTTLGPWSWLPPWSGHRKTSWRTCTNRHKKEHSIHCLKCFNAQTDPRAPVISQNQQLFTRRAQQGGQWPPSWAPF